MSSILLTAPAAEPLSLAEAKAFLRVEHADDDDVIGALISASRIHVEAQTRRALITQTWRITLDAWPGDGRLRIASAPLQELSAVRVYDYGGVAHAVDAGSFVLDSGGSALAFAPWAPAAPGRLAAGIELDVVVGYGDAAADVPEPLRQAVRLLIAHWYENRGLAALGTVTILPTTAAALIAAAAAGRIFFRAIARARRRPARNTPDFPFHLKEAIMAASTYDGALARLLVHEGGYTDHPSDPGGPTNFGITIIDYRKYVKPGATAADVRAMRLDEAKRIYRAKYWDAQRCDELPAGVDYSVFDYGVNSGIGRSGKVLRRCLGIADDSSAVNDAVIAAAVRADAKVLVAAICDERLRFLQRLKTWEVFGKGWGRRVADVRSTSLALAAESAPQQPKPASAPMAGATRSAWARLADQIVKLIFKGAH